MDGFWNEIRDFNFNLKWFLKVRSNNIQNNVENEIRSSPENSSSGAVDKALIESKNVAMFKGDRRIEVKVNSSAKMSQISLEGIFLQRKFLFYQKDLNFYLQQTKLIKQS